MFPRFFPEKILSISENQNDCINYLWLNIWADNDFWKQTKALPRCFILSLVLFGIVFLVLIMYFITVKGLSNEKGEMAECWFQSKNFRLQHKALDGRGCRT